jgi:sugar/nucleoside kinase (ribokinase family)
VKLVAVGSIALDSIETPFGSAERVLGGSGTYLTLAARYLTDQVGLVGVVGADFPESYRERLRVGGVDLSGLVTDPAGETFAWAGRYDYDLNTRDRLATHLNVLATFEPQVPEAYLGASVLCLGNLAPQVQQQVLDQVRAGASEKAPFVLMDTMNYWIESTPDELAAVLGQIDCLVINDSEARELADDPNLIRAARKIRAMGPEVLVIKKGEHGALLFADGVVFSAPAYPLEDLHDPTGAGDAFMGGFAGYLATCDAVDIHALKCAVVYGSALASFAVEQFGPDALFSLDQAQIEARLDGFRVLSEIPAFGR